MTDAMLHEYGSLQDIKVNEAFAKSDISLSKWLNEMYETIGVVEPGFWTERLPASTKISQVPIWAAAYEWEVAARFLCVDKKSGHGLVRARVDGTCRAILKRHGICKRLAGSPKGEEPEIESLLPIWLVSGTGGYLEHARRVLDKGESEFVERPRVPVKDVGPSRVQSWLHLGLLSSGERKEHSFPLAEFLYPDGHTGDIQSVAERTSVTESTEDIASLNSASSSSSNSNLATWTMEAETSQGDSYASLTSRRSMYSLRKSSASTSVQDLSRTAPSTPETSNGATSSLSLDEILEDTGRRIRKGNK